MTTEYKSPSEQLNYIKTSPYTIAAAPKYTWSWGFGENNALVVNVVKPPNFFHRWMQTLILGIKWTKLP